jgi:predicted choloylglycine hydrolase
MPAACLLALLPLVLASCSWDFLRWPAWPWRSDPWEVKRAESGAGQLVIHEGVPILHLRGTPDEMGIQEGRLVGRVFRELRRTYLADFLGEEYESYRSVAQPFTTLMPPTHLEELQAFARGAREPLTEVVLGNTFLDLSRAARCSVLIAHGEAAKDGALLFARNLDFPDLGVAHKASFVKVYHPAVGRAFLSIGWPGMIGVTSGMNDAGLCIATLISLSEAGVESGEPYTMMNRRILEQCTTPEQAVKLVEATTRTCANSLVVAGPDGVPLVIEYTPAKVAVRRSDRGVLVATNMFRCKEHVPQPTQLCERFVRVERLAAASHGKLDLGELQTILRAVGQHSPRLTTLQSMVFEPAARRLHVAIDSVPACDGQFVTLDASQLFESPL